MTLHVLIKHFFTFFTQAEVCDPDETVCVHQQIVQLQIPDRHNKTIADADVTLIYNVASFYNNIVIDELAHL